MTREEHKEIILQFLKQHPSLSDLQYSEEPAVDQKIVRLVVDDSNNHRKIKKSFVYNKEHTIIDPFYEQLFDSFTGITFHEETVNFIKNIASKIVTREDEIKFVLEFFTKQLIKTNIDSKILYFVTSDNSAWDSEIWDETIIVPDTVEELLGV